MKTVSVVTLTFNNTKDTLECLESISKLKTENFKLQTIVVDNASDEEFRIKDNGLKIMDLKIIRNEKNLGFSAGNNVGIRHALKNGADYILILNNDTLVDKNLVSELVAVAESDDNIGITAPKIYFAKGSEFHKDRYKENEKGRVIWYAGGVMDWQNVIASHRGVDEVDTGQYEKIEETDYASGCCFLIKKEVLEEVGFFDERYYLYYEDNDLSQRVKGKSYKIMFAPLATLWHKNAGSSGGSGSPLQDYYITRNRLVFGMRYAPLRSKVALLRESIGLLFNGRPWQRQGVLDFYTGNLSKGSYPI